MIYICSLEPNRYENVNGTRKTCIHIKTLERSKAPILHKMGAKHELVGGGGGGGLKNLYKCCTFMYPTEVMEIFMDDFLVYGSSFEHCLQILGIVLQRC